jgi:Tuberculosis necrotizing toxin
VAGGAQPDQQAKQAPAPVLDKPSAVVVRRAKPVLRPEDTPALFLAYLFPIGHMPVPTSRPARQLPVPPEELDFAAGLRFPPHDHPDSALIDDIEAAGSQRRVELPEPRSAEDDKVVALAEEHDPLGGEHERDWDRRFLVRQAAEGTDTEYSWPPGESFPEGGCAEGEAIILDHGTVIDRFGTVEGRVFAPDATPFPQRSLPPEHLESGYRRYRVIGRLPVWQTISAPWFGQPGGGVRYRAVYPAADLIALGYLEIVNNRPESSTEVVA